MKKESIPSNNPQTEIQFYGTIDPNQDRRTDAEVKKDVKEKLQKGMQPKGQREIEMYHKIRQEEQRDDNPWKK